VVLGGNGIVSAPGDPITQPGNVDVNCLPDPSSAVCALSTWVDILNPATNVDAAMAQVIRDSGVSRVKENGTILEIGTISSSPLTATLNLAVKKSGRSGLSTGKVVGLNAQVSVAYENECAGQGLATKVYTGQILVSPGKFIIGGDSGSLMVENKSVNPRPVGLLFAGSSQIAVANPINQVLTELGAALGQPVSMVGGATSASSTSTTAQTKALATAVALASGTKQRHTDQLEQISRSIGHAVGFSSDGSGRTVIKVLVEKLTPEAVASTPSQIDGIPVELWEVGKIVAY
jgi:hypothetical protein